MFKLPGSRALIRSFALAIGLAASTMASAEDVSPEWQKVIDAAKTEGKVTIYSGQGLKQLNDLAARFKDKYGIEVEVVRAVESDLWPKVDVEHETGNGIADIMVSAALQLVLDRNSKGYALAPLGPSFDNPAYDRKTRVPEGTYFEASAAVLTFSWNKDLYPKGIKDYPDILDPSLEGKIGIPMAKTQGQVDFYLFLSENYGDDYIDKLAALKPRAYPGALPLGQAVTSGEIAVAIYGEPLIDEQEMGAPVDWGLAPKPWGARFYGLILKAGPHPNAAQLLADFMITEQGQEAIARKAAAVLPDIKGSIGSTDTVRPQDLSKLTPEFVEAFGERWDKLFAGN